MKQNEKANARKAICKRVCIECDLCQAINFEEKRTAMPALKAEIKALYGAEALSYYFYFFQAANCSFK